MAWCLSVGTYIYAEMGRGEREEGRGEDVMGWQWKRGRSWG